MKYPYYILNKSENATPNLNINLTQLRPSEIHYLCDPTARNGNFRHMTTRNVKNLSLVCFDRLEMQS